MKATGSVGSPSRCTSKCRCGPDEWPDDPTTPMICPTTTVCPSWTDGRVSMWQYLVVTLPACAMSTYQPQPGVCGEPSMSQPWLCGTTLHRTMVTVPAAAALMRV